MGGVRSRCLSCGRLIYPFTVCRNGMCERFGIFVSRTSEITTEGVSALPAVSDATASAVEHPAIVAARRRIRQVLDSVTLETRSEFGLTLVLIAQELGHTELAARLIVDFHLAHLLGVEKN